MSFAAPGVTLKGGVRISQVSRQVSPTGSVKALYDRSLGSLSVSNDIQDGNQIVLSPNSSGQQKSIHYIVEYALFNPFRRTEISGWRALGQLNEGVNTLDQSWSGQTIRINAVFRDGLGKTETVYGSPIAIANIPLRNAATQPVIVHVPPASPVSAVQTQSSIFSLQKITDATEGQAAVFRILRTGDISTSTNVQVQTWNATARMGVDYVAKNESLWFAPGESSKDVYVSTYEDSIREGTESFSLSLGSANPRNVIASSSGSATAFIADGPASLSGTKRIATAGQDILTGTANADIFQMYATPSFIAYNTRPDRITNFSPSEGDRLSISASAYRLKNMSTQTSEISSATQLNTAFTSGAALIYDRSTGLLHLNARSTVDGLGGPIVQFDNRPVFGVISDSIQIV